MSSQAQGIRAISQISNYAFEIEWIDGSRKSYQLAELQKRCPCAKCADDSAEKRSSSYESKDVRARRIYSVGRYAIRIEFTSGCSTGIYSYDFLYGFK